MVNRIDIVLREVSQWKVPGKIKEKTRYKGPSSKIEGTEARDVSTDLGEFQAPKVHLFFYQPFPLGLT